METQKNIHFLTLGKCAQNNSSWPKCESEMKLRNSGICRYRVMHNEQLENIFLQLLIGNNEDLF